MRIILSLGFWLLLITQAHAQIEMYTSPLFQRSTSDRPKIAPDLRASLIIATGAFGRDPRTLDCGCQYNTSSFRGIVGLIDTKTCQFQTRTASSFNPMARWGRLIPLDIMAAGRQCSAGVPECRDAQGRPTTGSACCLQIDPEFKMMSLDAWNWAPMIVEIDDDRQDFRFQMTNGGGTPYGQCQFRIDSSSGTIEPDPFGKGPIARAMLYFNKVWNVRMSTAQIASYEQWNALYPPTRPEGERAALIENNQQFQNMFYHNRR